MLSAYSKILGLGSQVRQLHKKVVHVEKCLSDFSRSQKTQSEAALAEKDAGQGGGASPTSA